MTTAAKETKPKLSLCRKEATLPVKSFDIGFRGYSFKVYEDINEMAESWDTCIPNEEFATSRYLNTLQDTNPSNLRNLYVLIFNTEGILVGTLLLQSLILYFAQSFRYQKYTTDQSFYSRILQRIRQFVVSTFKFRMLTVGNLYLTGKYGFHYESEKLDNQAEFELANKIVNILKKELCATPYRFSGVLFKDFFSKDRPKDHKKLGLQEFHIDPNMILEIRKSWKSFDDYLLDMRSKYRVRMKNALRKFQGLVRRPMESKEISQSYQRLYELYSKILTDSGFVLAKGGETYFLKLKERLGDRLNVIGYFDKDRLVGFYTWVLDEDKMDSHFIGFEPDLNHKYQIYLNILLDLVKDSIEVNARRLYYFRTALEIKSSVGAEPSEMSCYFRHTNFILNKLIVPFAFKYFVPKQSWDQRHPFKTSKVSS